MKSFKMAFGTITGCIIERIKSFFGLRQKIKIGSVWHVEHWRKGVMLTERVVENLCPDEFINHVLDVALSGGSQITTWYLALFSNNHTPVASNTYASPGYTEATGYDETVRQTWQEGGVSSKTITNSANKATFTMDGTDTTIYGCSLVSNSVKGDTVGGGILGPVAQFSAGAITGIVDADVIKVYMTVTGSDV
ncbi:uncharacterized protein Dvar_36410 [Desulfosarcina variabilis str. Montpellier]|uniref:hypothetical protein n=1 Tax=Desulfosarcina variabilis TaxID=2300 RepID=UPI003AFA8383